MTKSNTLKRVSRIYTEHKMLWDQGAFEHFPYIKNFEYNNVTSYNAIIFSID